MKVSILIFNIFTVGAIVGGVIGGIVGILLLVTLVGLVVYLVRRAKKKNYLDNINSNTTKTKSEPLSIFATPSLNQADMENLSYTEVIRTTAPIKKFSLGQRVNMSIAEMQQVPSNENVSNVLSTRNNLVDYTVLSPQTLMNLKIENN